MKGLDSPRLILERAKKHVDEFEIAVAEFLRPPGPYIVEPHAETEPDHYGWTLHILREPPEELGLIAGDAITNTRHALDHLLAAIIEHGCKGAVVDEDTYFPVCRLPEHWTSQAKGRLKNVPGQCWGLVEGVQPYHGPDWPETSYLWYLNQFARGHKHRATQVVYTEKYVEATNGFFQTISGGVRDGDQVVIVAPPAPYPYKAQMGVSIGFRVADQTIGFASIRAIHSFVRDDVLPMFEHCFD